MMPATLVRELPMSTPARHPARFALALAATALLAVAGWIAVPAQGQEAQPYSLSVTPTEDVIDGAELQIQVTMTGVENIYGGSVRICRDGPAYAHPDETHPLNAGNCPNVGLSSSATPGATSLASLPDARSAIGSLRVGTGRVEWGPATEPDRFELTCDAANPCRLVVRFNTARGEIIDATTLIHFADSSAFGGCSALDANAVRTTGPDRFIDTWGTWTRNRCEGGATTAPTTALFTGEGAGLASFQSGSSDLTYSATGPSIPGDEVDDPRASVSVPIAVNAVVIGALGGYASTTGDWPVRRPRPYSDLRVTAEEMATLFGNSAFAFSAFYGDTLPARSPQLATGLVHPVKALPMAPGNADATAWLATRWFANEAPDQWRTSPIEVQGSTPDTPRGVTDELSTATPPFPISFIDLYTQRPGLKRAAASPDLWVQGQYGPQWILTDLATAVQLGIPTAAVENERGEFVRPTPESLAAAVATMTAATDGTVVPPAEIDAAGAYPLTFVEHAVAPLAPLADEDCAPRTEAQALLTGWLDHVLGAGQQQLTGFVPLTPALAERADAARARVGTAPICSDDDPDDEDPDDDGPGPDVTDPSTPPGGFGGGPSFDLGGPLGSFGGGTPSSGPSGGDAPAPGGDDDVTPDDPTAAVDQAAAVEPELPPLLPIGGRGATAGALALVGLAVLAAAIGPLVRPRGTGPGGAS